MNAENRKLTAANVAQRSTLFNGIGLVPDGNVTMCSSCLQSHSEADADATAQRRAGVQRARGLTSAGVITHPSPDSSPL